MMSTFTQLLQG